MPDYSKSIIYTIKTGNSLYVGSTTNFIKRKYRHKTHTYINSKEYNFKLYKTIRENDGEWDMKPYKEYPCENKTQLTIEEERVRCELNADLNMRSCGTGLSEKEYKKNYQKKNKECIKEYHKNNYQKNKNEMLKKITCECGCVVAKCSLTRHKKTKTHLSFIQSIVN